MNVSEVLNKAADHIERYGHHKGAGYADVSTIRTAACLHGAISSCIRVADKETRDAARDAMREFVGRYDIGGWNDAPDRTAAEVVEALRACAVIEAAREVVRVAAEVSA